MWEKIKSAPKFEDFLFFYFEAPFAFEDIFSGGQYYLSSASRPIRKEDKPNMWVTQKLDIMGFLKNSPILTILYIGPMKSGLRSLPACLAGPLTNNTETWVYSNKKGDSNSGHIILCSFYSPNKSFQRFYFLILLYFQFK